MLTAIPQYFTTICGMDPRMLCLIVNGIYLLLVIVTLVLALKENVTMRMKVLNILIILFFPVIGPILYVVLRYFVFRNS